MNENQSRPFKNKFVINGYWLMVLTLTYQTFISNSLLFPVFGVSKFFVLLINILSIVILIILFNKKIKKWTIPFIILILLLTSVKVFFFIDIRFYKINIFLISSIITISIATKEEIKKFIEISSIILLVILILSVFGLIIQQSGLKPVFSFVAPNGRLQSFYYTSFGHTSSNVLRPSGIYDEPGTLAFMVAGLLILRQLHDLNQKLSLLLLFLGFITFSLAFLVFSLIFVVAIDINKRQRFGIILILVASISLVYITGFDSLLEDVLFSRFTLDQNTGGLRGAREDLLINAYNNLSMADGSILWGVNPYCTIDPEECLKNGYMGENPLAPLAYHGIFVAWPYYIFILLTMLISFKGRKYLLFLALMIMFVQRPYILYYGVSILGILPLFLYFTRQKLYLNS